MSRSFLTNLNLNKNQLLNAAIQPLSQAPQNPTLGQIYFDTGIGALRQWNGTAWIDYLSSADGNQFIESVGDNLTVTAGNLTLGGKVVIDDVTQTLSNKSLGSGTTLGADISGADAYTITNIIDPTAPQDVATKAYVDAVAQGLNVKESVVSASTTNYDLTTVITNPILVVIGGWGGPGLDWNSRVLLLGQTDPTENGIYVLDETAQGLVRAADQLTPEAGDYVFVELGTNAARGYIVQDVNLSGVYWTQFSAAGEYAAGHGINITDNAIGVNLGTGLAFDGVYNISLDGASGYGVRKHAENNDALTASGGVVTWTITHNFNSDVTVQIRDLANNQLVEVDAEIVDSNTVALSWVSGGVTANSYRAVVVG